MARRDEVRRRVELIVQRFGRYVAAYDEAVPFSAEQYEVHARTIAHRRTLGSAAAAIHDDGFIQDVRETLRAWGLGVRGSHLAPIETFVETFRAHTADIERLDGLSIDDPELETASVGRRLWELINSLQIVHNKAKLVAGTKALHHVLPDLVVPMDRAWTGTFFALHPPEWQDPYNQHRILVRAFEHFATVARATNPARYVGGGWRTSKTKVLDNAVIGFCKLELAGSPERAAVRDLRFEVSGFPPAKNEALSMLGVRHPHASRVVALLTAARDSIEAVGFLPFETESIGLEVVLYAPVGVDPWDATNYLGGIADVLEDKGRRGTLDHIGELRRVLVYRNDRQIKQVAYSQRQADDARYAVRIWQLPTEELGP